MNKKKSLLEFIAENNIFHIILSIILGFIVGTLFLILLGISVSEAYGTLFYAAFRSLKSFSYCLVYAAPYIMTGLSVAFAYKTGVFNIGAEGQYVMGAIISCITALSFPDVPKLLLIPLCLITAMMSGALLAIIVGLLKIYFKINEVLSMIMFNWIAFYFSNYIVENPIFKSQNIDATRNIPDNAKLVINPEFLKSLGLCNKFNFGIFLALLISLIIYFILKKTTAGYKLKVVGYNKLAAEYAGINVNLYTLRSLAIAGALAGLAGAIQILGVNKRVSIYNSQEGYGFAGIVVALIGACNPIGVFFSGIFYGTLKCAGRSLNLIGAPTQVIDIIVGTIMFFISISGIFSYLKFIKKNNSKMEVKSNV